MCCEGLDSVMHAPKCAYMYVCARVSENLLIFEDLVFSLSINSQNYLLSVNWVPNIPT